MSVEGFKDCMGTEDMGLSQAVCLHLSQPEKCKDDAWTQLNELTETEELLFCKKDGMIFFLQNFKMFQLVLQKVNIQA